MPRRRRKAKVFVTHTGATGASVESPFRAVLREGRVVDSIAQEALERELRLANKRLTLANQELQNFVSIAAHDLRSPMRTISAMTDLLLRRMDGQLDSECRQIAAHIQNGAAQMTQLISDLLGYSTAAGHNETATYPVDCADVLDQTIASLQSEIRATGAKITWDPLPVVQADNQLAGVFQNVIENALKYRSSQTPEIHVSAEPSGEAWIISVSDNGIGFEMSQAERIFAPFHRLHGAGEYEGTGIGLAICRKTIERYGGSIRVKSEPGIGSTFYFSVPAAKGLRLARSNGSE